MYYGISLVKLQEKVKKKKGFHKNFCKRVYQNIELYVIDLLIIVSPTWFLYERF